MGLIRACNVGSIYEDIPAAVGRPGALRRDGFVRRGALAPQYALRFTAGLAHAARAL